MDCKKRAQDIEKLSNPIDELEHLDIDAELDAHEKLQNWTELNNAITALTKKKHVRECITTCRQVCRKSRKRYFPNLDDASSVIHVDKHYMMTKK